MIVTVVRARLLIPVVQCLWHVAMRRRLRLRFEHIITLILEHYYLRMAVCQLQLTRVSRLLSGSVLPGALFLE